MKRIPFVDDIAVLMMRLDALVSTYIFRILARFSKDPAQQLEWESQAMGTWIIFSDPTAIPQELIESRLWIYRTSMAVVPVFLIISLGQVLKG